MVNSKKKKTCPCCKMNISGGNSGLLSHMKKSTCRNMILKCNGCHSEFATSDHLSNHQHYQQSRDPNTTCIQGMEKMHHVQILTKQSNQFDFLRSRKIFSVEQLQPPNSTINSTFASNITNDDIIEDNYCSYDKNFCTSEITKQQQETSLSKNYSLNYTMTSSFTNNALQKYNDFTFPNIESSEKYSNKTDKSSKVFNIDLSTNENTSVYYGISNVNEEAYMVNSDIDHSCYQENIYQPTKNNKTIDKSQLIEMNEVVDCDVIKPTSSFDETLLFEMKEVFDNDDYDCSDCSIHDYTPFDIRNKDTNSVSIYYYCYIILKDILSYNSNSLFLISMFLN